MSACSFRKTDERDKIIEHLHLSITTDNSERKKLHALNNQE